MELPWSLLLHTYPTHKNQLEKSSHLPAPKHPPNSFRISIRSIDDWIIMTVSLRGPRFRGVYIENSITLMDAPQSNNVISNLVLTMVHGMVKGESFLCNTSDTFSPTLTISFPYSFLLLVHNSFKYLHIEALT